MIAIPVVLGSLFRIPIGILADRYGGRRVFSALSLAWAIVFRVFARDAAVGKPTSRRHIPDVFLYQRLSWLLAFF